MTLLNAFTLFHVILSLIGIGAGLVVLFGWFISKFYPRLNFLFLITTVATSVTGFLFPFHGFTPGIVLGILSMIVLAIALAAEYSFHFSGGWRRTYAITAAIALYLNLFVLIAQMFQKIPFLHALAPAQSDPPFLITQVIVMVVFIGISIRAVSNFARSASSLSGPNAPIARSASA